MEMLSLSVTLVYIHAVVIVNVKGPFQKNPFRISEHLRSIQEELSIIGHNIALMFCTAWKIILQASLCIAKLAK